MPLAAPAQGTIRLDLSNLSLAALLALIHVIRDGLNGNEYYTDLTAIVAALTASESTLLDLLDTLAALEQQAKTIRAALATAILDGKEKLRAAAVACENTDRSDEALVSVGWPLRRSGAMRGAVAGMKSLCEAKAAEELAAAGASGGAARA